jgi:nitric oxide reductase NorD protein
MRSSRYAVDGVYPSERARRSHPNGVLAVTTRPTDGPERLQLVASAIAGCPVDVAVASPPGTPSWTDGSTVFVDAAAPREDQIIAVAVQSSLLACRSFPPEILAHLARRRAVSRRYLMVEGHRVLFAMEAILPTSVRSFIDRSLASRSTSPAASLSIAISGEPIDDPPAEFGAIVVRALRASAARSDSGSDAGGAHVPRSMARELLEELHEDDDDDDLAVDIFSSPIGGGGAVGRLLTKMFGDKRSAGAGPPGADSATHWTRRSGTSGAPTATSTAAASGVGLEQPLERHGRTYPEWDLHQQAYRPEWCTVWEDDPTPAEDVSVLRPDTHLLRRALSPLGMELERRNHQLQGIEVDIDAAIDARIEAMAGRPPDDEIYVDMVRRRRDLSVLVLLDVSGSTGEASPLGGSVHQHQCAAAARLMLALNDLGDRVALYSFRSQGRTLVYVSPVKRFADDVDTGTLRRLAGCVPGAYTRLGAAIRHATAVLERDAGTARRLLVVISDGFAMTTATNPPTGRRTPGAHLPKRGGQETGVFA